jgi:hypothetical protein
MSNREDQCIKALQYLWDEGFLRLWEENGEAKLALTTELSEVHDAIKVKFRRKADPADWWKNEKTISELKTKSTDSADWREKS